MKNLEIYDIVLAILSFILIIYILTQELVLGIIFLAGFFVIAALYYTISEIKKNKGVLWLLLIISGIFAGFMIFGSSIISSIVAPIILNTLFTKVYYESKVSREKNIIEAKVHEYNNALPKFDKKSDKTLLFNKSFYDSYNKFWESVLTAGIYAAMYIGVLIDKFVYGDIKQKNWKYYTKTVKRIFKGIINKEICFVDILNKCSNIVNKYSERFSVFFIVATFSFLAVLVISILFIKEGRIFNKFMESKKRIDSDIFEYHEKLYLILKNDAINESLPYTKEEIEILKAYKKKTGGSK